MTESEAIRRLKDHFKVHDDGRPTPYLDEAVSMAIKALEKVQALEENKTYHLYREYLSIGTVSEFRELKEKATAKKPELEQVEIDYYEYDCLECPNCGSFIGYATECEEEHYQIGYCPYCGQKLDWSEGKE